MPENLELGVVLRPHGVRGVLKAENWCGDELFRSWPKKVNLSGRDYGVVSVAKHDRFLLLSLEGVDTFEKADCLRGAVITCLRGDVKMPDGTVLFSDILGFEVFDTRRRENVGTVAGFSENGRQTLLEIEYCGDIFMVPAVPEYLKNIDVASKKITLETIEGMLPDED